MAFGGVTSSALIAFVLALGAIQFVTSSPYILEEDLAENEETVAVNESDLAIGDITPDSSVLVVTYEYEFGKFEEEEIVNYFTFPSVNFTEELSYKGYIKQNFSEITYISAKNVYSNDAYVSLSSGGIGKKNVTLKFTSPTGSFYLYYIVIYGK